MGPIGDAVEVDEDVDLVGADCFRGVFVGEVFDDAVVVEAGDDAVPERGAVVVAGAVAEDFEAGAVVAFEEFGNEVAHGVAAKVG